MRVAALGRTQFLYDAIRAVAARGHDVVVIGTSPAAPEYTRTESDFAALASELGSAYFCDTNLLTPQNFQVLQEARAEIGISVNWLTLVPKEILRSFPLGLINAHSGDLPRFRGNAAPNWAILAGEDRVVVSLHVMVADLDAGPIVAQHSITLTEHTYISDVYQQTAAILPSMFADVVDRAAQGTLERRPQSTDPADSLRCYPRLPSDGLIDWTASAESVGRLVRASADPFAGAFTFLGGRRLIVWRGRTDEPAGRVLGVPGQIVQRSRASGEVTVLCGDGYYVLEQIEFDGERRLPAEVITSTRSRLGLNLVEEVERLQQRIATLEAAAGAGVATRGGSTH